MKMEDSFAQTDREQQLVHSARYNILGAILANLDEQHVSRQVTKDCIKAATGDILCIRRGMSEVWQHGPTREQWGMVLEKLVAAESYILSDLHYVAQEFLLGADALVPH